MLFRSVDLPDPGIAPGSPALQVDSLPTELSGKPQSLLKFMSIELVTHSAFFMVKLSHPYMTPGKTMKVAQPCPTTYDPMV